MDKSNVVYKITCDSHGESYVGETGRPMRKRGHEHQVVSRKDAMRSHSIKEVNIRKLEEPTGHRKSKRTNKRVDYKKLHTGEEQTLSEGQTAMSSHMAKHDHKEGEVRMEMLCVEKEWKKRGIREAIEIKRHKPTLNDDEGRYFLPAIYDTIEEKTRAGADHGNGSRRGSHLNSN